MKNITYELQQKVLNDSATKLGVVAYRPDYHGKDRDLNTVMFYTREDEAHNRLVDKQPVRYTASEAFDRKKYSHLETPDECVYRNSFWNFENSNANGILDYRFANRGKVDLRGNRWREVLEGHIQLALVNKMRREYISSTGGYLALREADSVNNDLNREEIHAIKKIYGEAYLVEVNYFGKRREDILSGRQSIYEPVGDDPIYNFSGSFCVPTKDQELEQMILAWNDNDRLPKKGADIDKIQDRVDKIGGINLLWF